MTIFLDLAKSIIQGKLMSIIEKSTKADAGLINRGLSLFYLGRDTKLSRKKRELAQNLASKILYFVEGETDAESYAKLVSLIEACKEEARKKSSKKGYDEGDFGPKITRLLQLLQKIYVKFEEAGILNVPNDGDPFNIFRFHAGRYIVQKLQDQKGIIHTITHNPKLTAWAKLTEEKSNLLLKKLRECERDLDGLDTSHEEYNLNRRKCVFHCLSDLLYENTALCTEYGSSVKVPVTFSFIASLSVAIPTLAPENGFLETCVSDAKAAISPGLEVEEKPRSFTV